MKNVFNPTIDSVIADFTKASAKLFSLHEKHTEQSKWLSEIAAKALTKANEEDRAAQRALSIADKINKLIA